MIRNRNMVFQTAHNSSPDADKYIRIPQIAAASEPTAAAALNGALYYDTTNNILKCVINSAWTTIQYSA